MIFRPHVFFVALLFFLLPLSVAGQGENGVAVPPEIEANMKILSAMEETDTAKYVRLARKTIRMAERRELEDIVAECHDYLITYFLVATENDLARAEAELDEYKRFIDLHPKHSQWFYTMWQNLIMMQYDGNDILHATKQLNEMLAHAKEKNDPYGKACAYTMFGYLNEEYSYETAMENYKLALKFAKQSGNTQKDYYIYQQMAHASFEHKKYDETFIYIEKAQASEQQPKQRAIHEQAFTCLKMRAYIKTENRKEAQRCYKELKELWDKNRISHSYTRTMASAFCEYLYKYGDPDEAVKYWEFVEEPLDVQVRYYQLKGDYKTAFELNSRLDSMKQAAMAERQRAEIANANVMYNTQLLKDENQQLEMDNMKGRNNLLRVALVSLLVIVGFGIYLILATRRHARQLKSVSDLKTAFINNLSHEIRTPLNSILGFNELLNNSGMDYNDAERTEMLNAINEQATAMMELTNDVIFISRIDANDIKPVVGREKLNNILTKAANNIKGQLAEGVEMHINLGEDICLNTDSGLLSKAITCVLENAAKFTKRGSIDLDVAYNAENIDDVSEVIISVTDTGEGIPTENAKRIFERFEKLGSFDTGFGLGLNIAKESLALIGGSIRLDTDYKEGARFIIDLNL